MNEITVLKLMQSIENDKSIKDVQAGWWILKYLLQNHANATPTEEQCNCEVCKAIQSADVSQ